MEKPGYHLTEIEKGEVGTSSKILEEVLELQDAEKQNCKIMALVELSDLIGAIRLYLDKNHPDMTLADLECMSKITERAFVNGRRGEQYDDVGIVIESIPIDNYNSITMVRFQLALEHIVEDWGKKFYPPDEPDPESMVFIINATSSEQYNKIWELINEHQLQDYFILS